LKIIIEKCNIKDDKISDKGFPSQISARKIGAKIKGVKCVILDEISMLSLSNLHIFESRIRHGVATNSDNIIERNNILNTPFGGIHIILSGDFYQLNPIMAKNNLIVDPNSSSRTITIN
jgi:hypothetical protein